MLGVAHSPASLSPVRCLPPIQCFTKEFPLGSTAPPTNRKYRPCVFKRCRDKSHFCLIGASDSYSLAAGSALRGFTVTSAGVGRPQQTQSLECCLLWCLFLTGNDCDVRHFSLICHWSVFNAPQPQRTKVAVYTSVKYCITLVSV